MIRNLTVWLPASWILFNSLCDVFGYNLRTSELVINVIS
jgi:hypothetical protein